MKNYYKILGVDKSAEQDEIRVAYRLNAKKYHPDLNPGNESYRLRFIEIKNAYETLSKPDERTAYDRELIKHLLAREEALKAQASAAQAQPTRPQPTPAPQPSQPPPPPPAFDKKQAELMEIHRLELKLVRASAQEEILKFKKAEKQKFDAFKKAVAQDRKKLRDNYNKSLDKFVKNLKKFRENIKKSEYHRGVKDGIQSAQNSVQATQELNNELQKQIELLDRLSKAEQEDCGICETKIAEAVAVESDALKLKITAYEQEINDLNEEILRLTDALKLWQASGVCGAASDKELEEVQEFEEEQLDNAKGTLYGVLGVYLNAIPDEIKEAYDSLRLRYENEETYAERFKAVQEAYRVLSNPQLKAQYDSSIDNEHDI
ncbi:MAG: DnaJ domain-containing protein [Firmicutes bacterium]|nr:DnaJ domain-containing protein [Bacillota bacterium]